MSEYNRHKFAMEWMYGGGRDPNGRGLDEEIQIADDMWKERVSMAEGGTPQLVQPGPGRVGYAGKPQESTTTSWKKKYKIKAFDEVADLFLKTYAEDDIDHIYKVAGKLDDKMRFVAKDQELIDYVSKQSGLSENQIFNMLEDKAAHADLMSDIKTQEGRAKFDKPVKDLDNRMRNWLMKNSKKYADPDKFKKSFNRVFGKNNYISKAIRMDKRAAAMVGFVDDEFVKTYISDKVKNPEDFSFSSRQLDDMFKTLIYNNNENVRNKVVKTFENILPKEKIQKEGVKNIHNAIKNNEFLQKFNLDKGINGPVARLIAKNLDEKLIKQIDLYKKPYFGTRELLNYLGDHVDPQYKSMFKEAEQAVTAMQNDGWSKARKHLDTGREIMFDHKIPSSLIEAGYADEIEYIKLNPTSQEFNVNIKGRTFDRPMNTLVRQFEKAKTLDEKSKIYQKMVAKKDAFSKKYGNYLDEVKITMDEKGKLKFASDAPVVTKQTDLTKMLKTSLGQEKFPTMGGKDQIKFLKEAGFKIDKCLKLAKGGSPDQCIRGVIEDTAKKARGKGKEAKAAQKIFKKSTGLASKALWFLGPLDIPIEMAFALPHLLMGDVEAAKRATTFGLVGWGEIDFDKIDNKEAQKYLKHKRDTNAWIDNWRTHDYYSEKLKNLPEYSSNALRNTIEDKIKKHETNMQNIYSTYEGYDRSGSENEDWAYHPEEMAGKKATQEFIRHKVQEDLKNRIDLTSPEAVAFGRGEKITDEDVKESLRQSPKDLESYIASKGEDFYGDPEGWFWYKPLVQEEAEAHGVPEIFDDYFMGAAEGKDIRDAYSSIPLDYASQLGALEAKETREGLEAYRRRNQNPLNEMYYNKGGRVSYLDGGIASLKKK